MASKPLQLQYLGAVLIPLGIMLFMLSALMYPTAPSLPLLAWIGIVVGVVGILHVFVTLMNKAIKSSQN